MVSHEAFLDETVGDTPKCVFQIKKCDMGCLLTLYGTLDNFLPWHVMLNAPIDARQEGKY